MFIVLSLKAGGRLAIQPHGIQNIREGRESIYVQVITHTGEGFSTDRIFLDPKVHTIESIMRDIRDLNPYGNVSSHHPNPDVGLGS